MEEIEADDEHVPEIDETEFPVDEETENTSSEASTETTTSTSLARRRRWLIFKEEIELKVVFQQYSNLCDIYTRIGY